MNVSSLSSSPEHLADHRVNEHAPAAEQQGSKVPFEGGNKESSSRAALAKFYGPIHQDLLAVEHQLTAELSSPHPQLQSLLEHGTQLGGKRLRPAMLLLFGHATGEITQHHRTIATVIEMVHTATLIHDDVLDQANSRRHVPTINHLWNSHTSILVGDYLFSQAYRLAATTGSTVACEKVGEAARKVCEGELRQVLQRDHISLSESTYLSILQAKTGELCSVACELGARLSGGSHLETDAAAAFGNYLGVAFQIADDYLDLWGDDLTVGKTLGTDLEQGKVTLPIIRLLDSAATDEKQQIFEILSGPSTERAGRILPLLEESDARQYTMAIAQQFHAKAVDCLKSITDGNAKRSLIAMADFSIDRRF